MPGMDGITCLQKIKESGCEATVIVLTSHGTIPTAISAIKLGAYEFIEKPFLPEDLVNVIRDASALKDQRIHVHDPIVSYIQKYAIQIHSREEVANHFDISPTSFSDVSQLIHETDLSR